MDFPKILFGNSFVLDKPMGVVPRFVAGKFVVHIEQVDVALIEILRQQSFQLSRSHYDLRIRSRARGAIGGEMASRIKADISGMDRVANDD